MYTAIKSETPALYAVAPPMPAAFTAAEQSAIAAALHILEARAATKGQKMASLQIARDYLKLRFAALEHEVFACLWLDSQHAVISFEEIFRGTIDSAAVYPREVVKRALALNAAAVIFAHNHPSGNAEPSDADKRLTDTLKTALALVGTRVLDHIVVGGADTVSFAERGLI